MIETFANGVLRGGFDMLSPAKRSESISSAVPGTAVYDSLTFGAPTYTGRMVNPNTAMTYTAVWACVKILAESVGSVDLRTYRNVSPDGLVRELATSDYRYRMLREQPNEEMTSMQWREFMMASLTTWGNSYSYLEWDGRQRLKAIWPMRPDWVVVLRNPRTMKLEYRYQPAYPFASPVPAGVFDNYSQGVQQILHIPGLGWDGVNGYSPITMCRNAVALGQAMEERDGRFIAGGGTQKVALVAPAGTKLNDPDAIRREWKQRNGGMDNTGDIAILHGGLDVKVFGINPKDAQFLEGRSFQLAEIARIFNVPLGMLHDVLSKPETYASAEQADLRFVKYSIRPWCTRIEQKINLTVLASQDKLTCQHDLNDLLRGDLLSQMNAYKAGVTGGLVEPNEGRARLGLPPSSDPGADGLWLQGQMVRMGTTPKPQKPAVAPQKPTETPQA